MLKQRSQEDGSPSSLLDNIAKATIEVFQQQTEDVNDRNGNGGQNGNRHGRRSLQQNK